MHRTSPPLAALLLAASLFCIPSLPAMEILRKDQNKAQAAPQESAVKQGSATKNEQPTVPSGPPLILVNEGKDPLPIIIAKDAPYYTRRAAKELATFIEKTSGTKPDVLEGAPDPLPDHAIWVGKQPGVETVFPDVNLDFANPEEILIYCDGKNLLIAGRDKWDPENPTITNERGKETQKQQEYGTANAVYTFVQDYLGVRWLWPGELGTDILERNTIEIDPIAFQYHPRFQHRIGIFGFMAANHRRGNTQEWPLYHRLLLGSLDANFAGHGFADWWDRYHRDHPDYFALQPDGTRSGFPEPSSVKICHSNPAVWQQWIDNVEEELKTNPHATVFSASPNDSYTRGHCVCEGCLAWDHPDGERFGLSWGPTDPWNKNKKEGETRTFPSLTDRHVKFANTVGRMLKEKYPDKDYYVALLAYGVWRPAPIAEKPDDNVLIVNVANYFWDVKNTGKTAELPSVLFEKWGKLANKQIWRPNTGDPAGWQKGLADVPFTRRMEVFRHVADNNAIGIYVDKVWNYWATQGPIYYLMAQLAWNPYADGHAIMDDYYQRGFGPASAEIKEYWTMMEKARDRKVDEFPGETLGYPEVYDAAFFNKTYGLLDQAAAKTADAPKKYAERVAYVRVGLDYIKLMSDIRAEVAKVIKSNGADKEADQKARELWAKVDVLSETYPDAMNWKYVVPDSRQMRRGSVMHPDQFTPKKGKKAPVPTKEDTMADPNADLF